MPDDIAIHTILEMQGPLMPMQDIMLGLTDDMLAAQRPDLERTGGLAADGQMIAAIRSFVVRTRQHTIIVDTGVGNGKSRPDFPGWDNKQDTAWIDGLAAAAVTPEQIDLVICTHLHVDHIGWNTRRDDGRWVPTFPNARYVFGRIEYEYWAAENQKAENPAFIDSVLPVVQAGQAELVAADAAIVPGIDFWPTPGHTPGHCSVLVGGAAVIAGDVAHSTLQIAYPDISPRFDVDPAKASLTRRALFARFADTPTALYFTHPAVAPISLRRDGDHYTYHPA